MNDIEVRTISAEEASYGATELWRHGEQIAYTHYDPGSGDLVLQIDPRPDGSPVVIEVRCLALALAEVDRILSVS